MAAASVLGRVGRAMPRLLGLNLEPVLPSAPVHLFISPEGGIGVFTETHYRLARIMAARGHAVAGVWCYGLFPRCPVKQMRQLSFKEASLLESAVCLHCAATNDSMARNFGIPLVDLRRWPTPTHLAAATNAVDLFAGRLLEFEFDGVAFGKLAAMDLVLATKRCDLSEPDPETEAKWRVLIKNSLFSFLLFTDVLSTLDVTSVILFNDYSMMLAARLAAERRGIRALTITQATHLNNDNSRVVVRKDIGNNDYQSHLATWRSTKARPLTSGQVTDVCDDVIVRLKATGSHTFSPSKTLVTDGFKAKLGFPEDCRLIVAYTSSLDELVAQRMTTAGANRAPVLERQAFDTQVEWLGFLAAFVARRPDVHLAIRVHPREGAAGPAAKAGKIQRVESEHLQILREAFPGDPPCTKIFWPDDPVSSYDLAEIADVATVSFSTIGLELARLGVPVVAYVEGVGPYVADCFTPLTLTPAEFETELSRALQAPPSADTWRLAMRFSWFAFLGQALDLRSVIDGDGRLMDDEVLRTDPACDEVEALFTRCTAESAIKTFAHARPNPGPRGLDEETAALAAAAERLLSVLGHPPEPAMHPDAVEQSTTPMVARLQHFYRQLSSSLKRHPSG